MALLNKNNQKVKLADGLTEIGLSQVKSEIGGGSGAGEKLLKMNLDTHRADQIHCYLASPESGESYVKSMEDVPTTKEALFSLVTEIVEDYDLNLSYDEAAWEDFDFNNDRTFTFIITPKEDSNFVYEIAPIEGIFNNEIKINSCTNTLFLGFDINRRESDENLSLFIGDFISVLNNDFPFYFVFNQDDFREI